MQICQWKFSSPFLCLDPFASKSDKHLISSSNISPDYILIIHMNEGNDYQRKKVLIVKQILIVSTLRNELWTVWIIYILIVARKGLTLEILTFHLLLKIQYYTYTLFHRIGMNAIVITFSLKAPILSWLHKTFISYSNVLFATPFATFCSLLWFILQ